MVEKWKVVKGYEGLYEASNTSKLKSLRNGNISTGTVNKNGYYSVCIRKEGVSRSIGLHRLIALAWIPNPNNKPEVFFLNGNKADLSLKNLRWGTKAEIIQWSFDELGRKVGVIKPKYEFKKLKKEERKFNSFYFEEKYVGMVFSRLTILKIIGGAKHKMATCICTCGKIKNINLTAILCNLTTSCGCYLREATIERNTTHGLTKTPEYRAWSGLKTRCTNENRKSYSNYGGRGIKVCDRWLNSFENFLKDMGTRPSIYHSVDRFPDTDGDYEPKNCRWATRKQQGENKKTTIFIEYQGLKMNMSDWGKRLNIPIKTLSERYHKGYIGDKLFYKGNLKYTNEKFDN